MKQNLLFNQASALGKRLAMVLTMLLIVGIGQAWGATETITAANGVYSGSGDNAIHTWTLTSCTVVQAKGSGTAVNKSYPNRWYQNNKITFTPKSGYTITEIVLIGSGSSYHGQTITASTGSVNTNSSTYTSTWSGSVNSSSSLTLTLGKQFRFGSVTITYSATTATKHTVTLVPGSGSVTDTELTETSAGEGVTLPTPTLDCGDWEFAGWKTTSAVTTETTTEPTLIPAGAYSPTSDITLYAVYKRTEEGEGGGSTTTTFTFSSIASANNWSNGNAYTPVVISPITITANGGGNNAKYYTSDQTWRMYSGGSLTITTSTGNITNVSSNPLYTFTITNGTATCTFSETTKFKSITVTSGGGSTTYYHSTPECSTETLVSLNPNGGTFATEPDGWEKDGNNNYVIKHTGTEIPLPTNISQENKNFVGWYNGETQYTIIPADLSESITLTAKWSDKSDPGIAWNPETCIVTIDAIEEVPVEFQNPNELTDIAFESSDPTVAPVDDKGVITLGTTSTTVTVTITATFAGDATYAAKNVTCTLTVNPSNCRWVETEIGDIEPDDEVVVVITTKDGNTWALPHSGGTKTQPIVIPVTVNGNSLSSNIDNVIKWNIANDEGNLTFYPNGTMETWLYCNNDNDGVRVGKNGDKIYTIDASNGYLKHTATARYVGVYSNQYWRCYTSISDSNIPSQTLKFYKRECLDSEHYWVTWDADEGLWTDGSSKKLDSYAVGATITKPADPTREGYRFDGWHDGTAVVEPATTMGTSNLTYTAQWTKVYTVTFYNNGGVYNTLTDLESGDAVTFPATDPESCDTDNYPHFIGWTADPIVGSTTTQPELVENVKVTGDCDYYAVFAKGEGGSSNYQKVTSALDDWSGEYLIVNETNGKAFNGNLATLDANNNVIGVTISDNVIEASDETNSAKFTIAPYSTGYSIQSNSGKYIGETTYDNDLDESADMKYVNTISFSSGTVSIKGTGNSSGTYVALKYNSSASRFRYYKSGQSDIALYKKGSGVNYTSYITTCCTSWTAPTLTYPTELEENGTAMPQLGAGTTHGTVTYASSNPSILSVNSTTGEISAQAPGTATVTATWSGDETYCSVSSTSNVITVKGSFSVIYKANGGTGTMANQKADENNKIAQLNANQFTRTGYAFVGWNTSSDGTGTAYTDQQTNITLAQNLTLYAQWAPVVTLNDAGNEETAHPTAVNGTITLPDGVNACEPYEFVGWTSDAIADWNGKIEEPALVASPYKPTQPTTLYAVYKIQDEGNPNAFKLSFEGSNGNTYYVDEYSNSPLRGYSNITKDDAVTFIKTKMYPNDDTRYYLYMEEKGEYLYYNGYFNTTSSTPIESQGWIIHTVGDKIKLQSTYSYDPKYLYFSDRDNYAINIDVNASGSEFNMLSAVTSTYVASPLCNQEIEIIFETGNGDFVDNAPATNPLTVSRGDVITLPTCEYPGYEFMGWLKDEQQPEPSDIPLTYYTGDYTVSGKSSSITFYAYYKAVPEEVEFTGTDDTELLMYYYDGANYYYASSFDGENGELPSMQNCFNATTWTFTNVGNMQYHIQDETGKYLGAINDNDNDLSLSHTPKVWNFTLVNGLWKMVCEDSPSRALMYISTGKNFTNAAISNEGNGAYSYITLGICPYPTYTTQPVLSQGFSITNTAMVTSASGQKVKATSALTLETRNIELPCTFTVAAPNITFYDNTGAEVTQLTASAASEQFELHFAYKPTAENTMEYPIITITDDEYKTYTIKNRIYARSLPATFAIVAKVGNLWYALPSQGLNSTDALVGYPVEVDNQNDPTAVTAVPENADWSLRQVYAGQNANATKDRFKQYGANIMFENNASPAKMLNASVSYNYLLTDAQYANYYETNPGLYEWTPTTTDLETYTLTNAQRTAITLNVATNTVFGVHAQNVATNNLRFLPIDDRYTPLALQVVEWKENSIVVMYNGDPEQTASVSVNGGAAQTTTLSAAQRDIAVYELTANGLAANPTQRLSITIGTEKLLLPIPYIVNSNTTDATLTSNNKTLAAVSDLVVLNGKTLTADAATASKYTFRNVTIYGGGKLVIPADKGIGVNTLTMRLGTVNDDGSYTNSYPQLVLNGTINTGNINVDYLTTYDRYYALSLPYEVNTTSILYPADIYGDNLKDGGNNASFALQYYDGAERAKGATGWKDFDESGDDPTLTRYKGYTFWGAPRKVKVNGATEGTRQKYGIHRIPITETASDLMKGEKSLDDNGNVVTRTIGINAYPAKSTYDMGWNFIGNPFLAAYGKMQDDDAPLELGMLVMGESGWERQGTVRYITTTEDGKYYIQTPVTDVTLYPFNTFFVQAAQEGAISFNVSNRLSLPARQYAAQQEAAKEITTGIILTGNDQTDRTGLLIADNFTEEYDFNADLSKFENSGINLYTIGKDGKLAFMAINQALAEQPIPLGYGAPADGEYTIAFDEDRYNATDISALYLIDYDRNEKTNLLHTEYSFVTAAGTNNERFALQVAFIPQNATSVEWVDDATIQVAVDGNNLLLNNLPTDAGVQVFDALGRVIYATPNAPTEMQITLPTGYYLVRIADKQHAVVINIVIP